MKQTEIFMLWIKILVEISAYQNTPVDTEDQFSKDKLFFQC